MQSATQHRSWFLGTYRRAAGAALAFTILFGLVLCTVPSGRAQTYTESVLYSFKGPPDAAEPRAGLIQDAQGNLYGTTYAGGASGWGAVFKLDTTGNETVLYSFTDGADGGSPIGGLVRDAEGNLYGATVTGGASGNGTVFEVDTSGKETVLYSFAGAPDGAAPYAGLIQDAQGNLYGTTEAGGNSTDCPWNYGGCGTVFKVALPTYHGGAGTETVLYSFAGAPDGANPGAGLVQDGEGMYSTAVYGGDLDCPVSNNNFGCGTVFKLDTGGNETVLHTFTGASGDGADPYAGLVEDAQGNFYGTTYYGGDSAQPPMGCGTVFEITPTGETVLYSFTTQGSCNPNAGLIQDAQGNLYGTTVNARYGTVFKVDMTGNETVLYSFAGAPDGAAPVAGLIQDAQGNLYGTTEMGGTSGAGTVFKLTYAAEAKTVTTLTSSPNPSALEQFVTFTATVTSQGSGTPTGTVTFTYGDTILCNAEPLTGEVATCAYSALPQGSDIVTAAYSGNANFAPSSSGSFNQTVLPTTTTTLASSANPSMSGSSVTFTTTVTTSGSTAPTGTVTFMDGPTALGTGILDGSGIATYATSSLGVGQNSMTATYDGDANNAGSTSAVLTQIVNATDFTLSPNPSSATVTAGQSGTFTLTVTPQGSFTSPITFSCSGLPALAGCTFNPASVTPNSSTVTSTLSITTTAQTASLTSPFGRRSSPLYATWLVLPAMLLGTVGMAASKRRKLLSYCLAFLLVGGCLLQAACGSGSNGSSSGGGGTPNGTYTITITGAAGSTQNTTTVTLTIQ